MSFVDLATLAFHRRNELEARINVFVSKCDLGIENIQKLKMQAKGFVHQLNCDQSDLKERFLNAMKGLDEYIYLLTDFNLAVSKLEETSSTIDLTPVHDRSMKLMTPIQATVPFNILDVLSEPSPSTSSACQNQCPIKHKPRKVPKEEQTLIVFSSASSSSESMPGKVEVEKKEQEVQCELTDELKECSLKDTTSSTELNRTQLNSTEIEHLPDDLRNLPAQSVLQADHIYEATIMNIDGPSLWVITEDTDTAHDLMTEMTNYYKKNQVQMSFEEITTLTYCAYYDEESDCYYRALFIRLTEEDVSLAEVFVVDTGEVRQAKALTELQPLDKQFFKQPPFARCCHLAGVEISYDNKEMTDKLEQFLEQYIGKQCCIEVDDNTSESLGVYVILSEDETLNNLLVKNGLAISTEKSDGSVAKTTTTQGPPELEDSADELDITNCPEYDDPLEAVTGYSCKDEADICKHYKGGPEKTCFKGIRCKKRHVLMHPDGWTLDRMEVVGKIRTLPLPAPGTWIRVHVTCVCHFDRLHVQFCKDQLYEEPLPDFGVVLPPTTLDSLVQDMNSPAQRVAYKPLKAMPAPGEVVAALYPPDNQWYRARVLTVTRANQNVEVMYLDYGNVVWVSEAAVRALEPRHCALAAQAVRCVLAGVAPRSHDSRQWAAAKKQLEDMTQDRTLDAQVVARTYDELTVELFDEHGYSIAEQLAALNFVTLKDYSIVDDSDVTQKIVVP